MAPIGEKFGACGNKRNKAVLKISATMVNNLLFMFKFFQYAKIKSFSFKPKTKHIVVNNIRGKLKLYRSHKT